MVDDLNRRRFLKYGLITAGSVVSLASILSLDVKSGFETADHEFKLGQSQAHAMCGTGMGCSGGGGQCGTGMGCSGGGGQCGTGMGCGGR